MPDPVDVSKENVGKTVQDFIDIDNVKHLEVEEKADGIFTITPKD